MPVQPPPGGASDPPQPTGALRYYGDVEGFAGRNSLRLAVSALALRALSIVTMPAAVVNSLTNATDLAVSSGTLFLNQLVNSNRSVNNVNFRLSGQSLVGNAVVLAAAGTIAAYADFISFSNSNGVSFGQSTSTLPTFGQVNIITGNFAGPRGVAGSAASTLTNGTLVFSNANGVSFGLSGSTMTASVAAGGGAAGSISAGTTSMALGQAVFSNSNNVSFGLNVSTLTASMQPGVSAASAGTTRATSGELVFSNSNGVSFGINGQTLTGSIATSLSNIRISAGTTSNLLSALTFSNSNNVSFGLNGSVVTATATFAAPAASSENLIAAGTQTATPGTVVFSNSNGVTFGMSGSSRVTASFAPELGLVSHVGGQSVADITRLAFSNASNVTWSLSTAAGGATVLASVAPGGGGGGVAVSAQGNSVSAGTVVFSNGPTMLFGMAGSTVTALPFIIGSALGASVEMTRIAFTNANGVTFGLSTGLSAASISASVLPAIGQISHDGGDSVGNATRLVFQDQGLMSWSATTGASAITLQGKPFIQVRHASGGDVLSVTRIAFSDANGVTFGQSTAASAVTITASAAGGGGAPTMNWFQNMVWDEDLVANNTSLAASVFISPLLGFAALAGNMTLNTLDVAMEGLSLTSTQSTGSWGWTYRGALYTLANSTQLSIVNSFETTFSSTTQSFSARNASFAGQRYVTVHSSRWSSAPVLSAGVNYWFARCIVTAGVNVISAERGMNFALTNFRGVFGVNQTTSKATGKVPFMGRHTGLTMPASIGTAALITNAEARMIPLLQGRNGIGGI
jgi:hypothetical protein